MRRDVALQLVPMQERAFTCEAVTNARRYVARVRIDREHLRAALLLHLLELGVQPAERLGLARRAVRPRRHVLRGAAEGRGRHTRRRGLACRDGVICTCAKGLHEHRFVRQCAKGMVGWGD